MSHVILVPHGPDVLKAGALQDAQGPRVSLCGVSHLCFDALGRSKLCVEPRVLLELLRIKTYIVACNIYIYIIINHYHYHISLYVYIYIYAPKYIHYSHTICYKCKYEYKQKYDQTYYIRRCVWLCTRCVCVCARSCHIFPVAASPRSPVTSCHTWNWDIVVTTLPGSRGSRVGKTQSEPMLSEKKGIYKWGFP